MFLPGAALLGHLALLGLGLHDAPFLAELPELAAEDGVFAVFTLQRAVVERHLQRGLQTYLLEALLLVGEHPGHTTLEGVLQALANHLVGLKQVGRRDALAVGRVGDHQSLGGITVGVSAVLYALKVLEVLLRYGDIGREAGGLHVVSGHIHGLVVDVVAVDMVAERLLLRVIVIYLVEEFLVEVCPFLEGILLPEHSRSDVACYQRRLYGQGARAAHGVDEIRFAAPARHEYHASGQHLVQRSLHLFLAVSATV